MHASAWKACIDVWLVVSSSQNIRSKIFSCKQNTTIFALWWRHTIQEQGPSFYCWPHETLRQRAWIVSSGLCWMTCWTIQDTDCARALDWVTCLEALALIFSDVVQNIYSKLLAYRSTGCKVSKLLQIWDRTGCELSLFRFDPNAGSSLKWLSILRAASYCWSYHSIFDSCKS